MASINVGKLPASVLTALRNFPLMQPPKGVTPDFENRTFMGNGVMVAGGVGLAVLLVMLFVRIYAKARLVKKFTWDDYVYFVGWVAGVIYISINMAFMQTGVFGYHAWEVKLGNLTVPILALSRSVSILNGPLAWLTKLALFALIYTAFQPLRWTRILIYIGVIVSGIFYVSNSIVSGVYCGPKEGSDLSAYLYGMAGRDCASSEGIVIKYGIAVAVITIIVDFYILIIPLPAVWKLQVAPKKKLGIYLVFLAGLAACIASIVALVYRLQYFGNPDITYSMVPMSTVLIWETVIALMVPCAASIAKLYNHIKSKAPSLFSSSNYSSYFRGGSKGKSSKNSESLPSFVNREKQQEKEQYVNANKARINFKSWFWSAGTDTRDTDLSTTQVESVYSETQGYRSGYIPGDLNPVTELQGQVTKSDTITSISPTSPFNSPREAPVPPRNGSIVPSTSGSPEPFHQPPLEPYSHIFASASSPALPQSIQTQPTSYFPPPTTQLRSPSPKNKKTLANVQTAELPSTPAATELPSQSPLTELSSSSYPTELPTHPRLKRLPPPSSRVRSPTPSAPSSPPPQSSSTPQIQHTPPPPQSQTRQPRLPPSSHLKYSQPSHPHNPTEPTPRTSTESNNTLPACPYPPERPDPRDNSNLRRLWSFEGSNSRRGSAAESIEGWVRRMSGRGRGPREER